MAFWGMCHFRLHGTWCSDLVLRLKAIHFSQFIVRRMITLAERRIKESEKKNTHTEPKNVFLHIFHVFSRVFAHWSNTLLWTLNHQIIASRWAQTGVASALSLSLSFSHSRSLFLSVVVAVVLCAFDINVFECKIKLGFDVAATYA